jgi:radical SAM superfamily enzyme YgiQ (UPF0313 family)
MGTKKFLLISPRNPLGEGSSFPPLGLATIASHIQDNYEVKIIDEGVDGLINPDTISANVVGISVNTLTARRAYKLSRSFVLKGMPTILGGIHPTVMPEEAAEYATSVVIGNGEPVMDQIISDFERGELQKFYRPDFFDIAKSAVPRRELFSRKYITGNTQTTRGCPFSCKFCTVSKVHGRKYRMKPLEVVDRDLAALNKSIILLVDDNFFGIGPESEKRAIELLYLLKEHRIKWIGQTSINIANNEQILKLSRESGAIGFYIGFESLNEDFLRSIGKSVNLKQQVSTYKEVIKKIHDYGICVLGSFIYGTDFDTRDSLRMLRDFVTESGIDTTFIKPLTPFPGTEIYEEMVEENRLFNNSYWLEDPYPIFTFRPAKMTMDELMQASMDFMELYNLPKSIMKFGRSFVSTRNLWGSAICFLSNYGDYRKYLSFAEKIT